MNDARIFVAMPSLRTVENQTVLSLGAMMHRLGQAQANGHIGGVTLTVRSDSILPRSREGMVESALEMDSSHILWIDSDMVFPAEAAESLLRWDTEIVACNCTRRSAPFLPTARGKDMDHCWTTEEKAKAGGIEPVSSVGFGVTLIETSVFQKIPAPWFMISKDDEDRWVGEDVYFFRKAIDAGIQPYVDHQLSWGIKHIGDLPAGWDMAMIEKRIYEEGKEEKADADS